jgi:hypothetical protein
MEQSKFKDVSESKGLKNLLNKYFAVISNHMKKYPWETKPLDQRLVEHCEHYLFDVLGAKKTTYDKAKQRGKKLMEIDQLNAQFYMGKLVWITDVVKEGIVGFNKFQISSALAHICWMNCIDVNNIEKNTDEKFKNIWDKISEKGQ